MQIEKGARIVVRDKRKELKDSILAEGTVVEVSKQGDAWFAHLDTGYYVIATPAVKEGKENV